MNVSFSVQNTIGKLTKHSSTEDYKSLTLLAVRGKMDSIILKVTNSNQYSIVGVLIRR